MPAWKFGQKAPKEEEEEVEYVEEEVEVDSNGEEVEYVEEEVEVTDDEEEEERAPPASSKPQPAPAKPQPASTTQPPVGAKPRSGSATFEKRVKEVRAHLC